MESLFFASLTYKRHGKSVLLIDWLMKQEMEFFMNSITTLFLVLFSGQVDGILMFFYFSAVPLQKNEQGNRNTVNVSICGDIPGARPLLRRLLSINPRSNVLLGDYLPKILNVESGYSVVDGGLTYCRGGLCVIPMDNFPRKRFDRFLRAVSDQHVGRILGLTLHRSLKVLEKGDARFEIDICCSVVGLFSDRAQSTRLQYFSSWSQMI